jgi:Fur family ferric uptake transcriptional regulator
MTLLKRVSVKSGSKHGIRLTNHSLYLYGHCAEGDCRTDENAHEAADK